MENDIKKKSAILLGTSNIAKFRRFAPLIRECTGRNVLSLDSLKNIKPVPESGSTEIENACLKATGYAKQANLVTLAVDEGLYVDFLSEDKQPGPWASRIKNTNDKLSDEDLWRYWRGQFQSAPSSKRGGFWRYAACLSSPNGKKACFKYDKPFRFNERVLKFAGGYPLASLCRNVLLNKTPLEMTAQEKRLYDEPLSQFLRESCASFSICK